MDWLGFSDLLKDTSPEWLLPQNERLNEDLTAEGQPFWPLGQPAKHKEHWTALPSLNYWNMNGLKV